MGKTVNIRVDSTLEEELKRIQAEMKKQIGDIDVSQTQASKMAAKILKENYFKKLKGGIKQDGTKT